MIRFIFLLIIVSCVGFCNYTTSTESVANYPSSLPQSLMCDSDVCHYLDDDCEGDFDDLESDIIMMFDRSGSMAMPRF
jgi:hypothetical protein